MAKCINETAMCHTKAVTLLLQCCGSWPHPRCHQCTTG